MPAFSRTLAVAAALAACLHIAPADAAPQTRSRVGKGSPKIPSVPVTQSATLRWTAPQYNVDGSPLTDLAGYQVAYGTSPGRYITTLTLPNPAFESVVVEGLAAGTTYYFAVKAVNGAGVASEFSAEVSKSI